MSTERATAEDGTVADADDEAGDTRLRLTGREATPSPQDVVDAVVSHVARVLQGKESVVRLSLCCLLSEGHLLVEDLPGLGKTSLAKALAHSLGLGWRRIQFTPDLLPSDVIGVSVYSRSRESFEFRPGGIFANLVVADELNRASPKAQSALLEAMEERQVTADGTTYPLPRPFMVIATQNPLEHAGTYPLPDSQLDRFLMRLEMGYPDRRAELEMLDAHGTSDPLAELTQVVSRQTLPSLIAAVKDVYVAPALQGYLLDLVDATRRHPGVLAGASPRASLALQRATRAWAAMAGRDFATPDDVQAVAPAVLVHRLSASGTHGAGSPEEIVAEILARVPIPVPGR